MGLIKSEHAPASTRVFSMRDIENQAKAVLLRARQQADQLLAAAQAEGGRIKEQAHADGLIEGHREGLQKGREEGLRSGHAQALNENRAALAGAVAALSQAMQQIETSRRELESAARADVIELAIAIAQRITKKQGEIDPLVTVANVVEAMKLVIHASDVRIAIHPSHQATLDAELPKLKLQFPSLSHVEIVADDKLAPGGCRVFTTQGAVDGDLDEQLSRIIADLLPQRQEALA